MDGDPRRGRGACDLITETPRRVGTMVQAPHRRTLKRCGVLCAGDFKGARLRTARGVTSRRRGSGMGITMAPGKTGRTRSSRTGAALRQKNKGRHAMLSGPRYLPEAEKL